MGAKAICMENTLNEKTCGSLADFLHKIGKSPPSLCGTSLLAMAVDQLAKVLAVPPPSRAGSLPSRLSATP
jgi:hypothetical protein